MNAPELTETNQTGADDAHEDLELDGAFFPLDVLEELNGDMTAQARRHDGGPDQNKDLEQPNANPAPTQHQPNRHNSAQLEDDARQLRNAARRRRHQWQTPEFKVQLRVARWLDNHPVLRDCWCHVPNGGHRGKKTGKWMRLSGAKPGLPDVMVFEPCVFDGRSYVGCVVELKKVGNYHVSPSQRHWLATLERAGWLTRICRGERAALDFLASVYPLELARGPRTLPPTATTEERRAAVLNALATDDGAALSDSALARRCGLSRQTVLKLRHQRG